MEAEPNKANESSEADSMNVDEKFLEFENFSKFFEVNPNITFFFCKLNELELYSNLKF
jgi:hypothetical protein